MNLENYTEDMALVFCEVYIKTRLQQTLLITPVRMNGVGMERITGLVEEYLKEVDVLFNKEIV